MSVCDTCACEHPEGARCPLPPVTTEARQYLTDQIAADITVFGRPARLPSASGLGRAFACPPSWLTAGVQEEDSDAAARGTAIHRYVELCQQGRGDGALDAIPAEYRRECASLDLSVIPAGAEAEVPLGYLPGKEPVRYTLAERRGYPEDGLIHATLDLAGVILDDLGTRTAWYRDLKSGQQDSHPADSWQLRFGGLALARLLNCTRADVGFFEKIGDRLAERAVTLDEWALEDVELELATNVDRLRSPEAASAYAVGPQCHYCPALRLCPAHATEVRAMIPALEKMDGAELTVAQLGELYPILKRVEAAVDRVKAHMKLVVESAGAIPLPNGQELRLVGSGSQPHFGPDATRYVLEEYGPEVLVAAAKLSTAGLTSEQLDALERAGHLSSVPKAPSLRPVGKARK